MDHRRKKVKNQVRSSLNWADLPDDILDLILEKLVSIYDVIRSGFVCKAWNSIASIHKEKLIPLINHQPPWVFINSVYRRKVMKPKSSENREKSYKAKRRKQRLYNFMDGSEILNFRLRIPSKYKHRECFGSCYGWLFYKEKRNCVIVLVNPISGTSIRLPPISKSFMKLKDVTDFALSGDPCLVSFEVLALANDNGYRGNNQMVAHLKFGDEFWTYSRRWSNFDCLESFAFFEDYIFGVSKLGRMFYLYINHSENELSRYEIPRDLNKAKAGNFSPLNSNFVKTTIGDLLMVHEYHDPRESLKVFKIECYSKGAIRIAPTVDLDGDCIFLKKQPWRYARCISVLASKYPGCRANSIYHSDQVKIQENFGLCSWKEFNLEDQSLPTKNKQFHIYLSPPGSCIDHDFWMVPSVKL